MKLLILFLVMGVEVNYVMAVALIWGNNPDCSQVEKSGRVIRLSNRIVKGHVSKGHNGNHYYDGISKDDNDVIVDTSYRFLDSYYGDTLTPCEKQYNVCVAACLYRDACLPLWLLEDNLEEEEIKSDLYNKFRTFFLHNEYDQMACAIMYFNHDFGVCE